MVTLNRAVNDHSGLHKTERVLANKFLFAGGPPANNFLFAGGPPANKFLFAGGPPANNLFQKIYQRRQNITRTFKLNYHKIYQ